MSSVEQGYYSDRGEPLLNLDLLGRGGEPLPLRALVDTGFNGGLAIFRKDAASANLPPTAEGVDSICLADGSSCETAWTYGYVRWLGGSPQEMRIMVIHADVQEETPCLIGMEFLRGKDILLRETSFEIRVP